MNTPVQMYNNIRQENDIDLVKEVRDLMIQEGISQEKIELFNNYHYIVEAKDRVPEVQRYLLNRYWNIQLMMSEKVSINERYCLIPNGLIEDWLSLFKTKILPFIVKNNLPR